jgi:hypothetical protein
MEALEQDYGYILSAVLGIKEYSEPPGGLFYRYYNGCLNFNITEK